MAFPASNAFLYLCRGFSPTVWAVAARNSKPIPRLCLRSQEALVRDLYSKGGRESMCVPVYGSMCVRPERWCRVCRLLDMVVPRDRNCGSVCLRALRARCLIVHGQSVPWVAEISIPHEIAHERSNSGHIVPCGALSHTFYL